MKGIRITELLQEIRANLVAFLSIVMFICLGIGFFLGINWASYSLEDIVEYEIQIGSLHDIEIDFPFGVTEDDIKKVAAIEGVTDAEPGYIDYVSFIKGDRRYVFKIQSMTERIDTLAVVKGSFPSKPNEVALLTFWANELGISVGDTITFEHDAQEIEEDVDGMSLLTTDTFTVTGFVESPAYLSNIEGMLGEANIGTGRVDCVAFTTSEAFDVEKYDNGFPVLYLRCDGLRGPDAYNIWGTFSEKYQQGLAPIVNDVSELGGQLGNARFQQVVNEAQAQIDDGQQQVADGERQIADGEQQIADGEKQIADGEQQVADGEKALDDAEQQLADGANQLADGQQQIADGAQQIADGEQRLAAGERELAEKKREFATRKAEAEQKLADALDELNEYQKLYDDSVEGYKFEKQAYEEASAALESVRPSYESAVQGEIDLDDTYNGLLQKEGEIEAALYNYEDLTEDESATQEDLDEAWAVVEASYQDYVDYYYGPAATHLTSVAQSFDEVAVAFGSTVPGPTLAETIDAPSRDDPYAALESFYAANEVFSSERDRICFSEVTVGKNDVSITVLDSFIQEEGESLEYYEANVGQANATLDEKRAEYNEKKAEFDREVAKAEAQIADAERQLEAGRRRLAAGRVELAEAQATYNAKLREYEEALQLYNEKKAELEQGKGDLAKARIELEEARKTLEEKRAELEDAKAQLAEAQKWLDDLQEYEWIVFSRLENPGIYEIQSMDVMMGRVRWAMASLFVLVGLFVCYSAVARLINSEVAQIGAKKAMGFRQGEIALLYLLFSGLAVVIGTVLGGVMGVGLIEVIINIFAREPFMIPKFLIHFSIPELVLAGAIELVLIMAATWLAIRQLLKRNAIDLINGNQESKARTRFYEGWWLWKRLSLYSQTIINNCVNDKRRVVGTLVGVVGCTSLIVTALTLSMNISNSIKRHYDAVSHYDTIINLNATVDDAADSVSRALDDLHLGHTLVHLESLQVRQPDGYRMEARLVVPLDLQSFNELYHLLSLDGGAADLSEGGIWLSAGYAEHMGISAGDTVRVTEVTGETHELRVGGVFEFYLMRNEFVMSPTAYFKEFGEEAVPNALFVQKGDVGVDQLRNTLLEVPGYEALSDDQEYSTFIFERITDLLGIVVLLYLGLSALMALVVLLNLDIMFVDEKKRELLVLMINGFMPGAAKAYIYRESLVLTAIGIVAGVVLGSFMGNMTIGVLEPSFGYFIKGFNPKAALVGAAVAALFATIMMLISLRKISRFRLTDINKF